MRRREFIAILSGVMSAWPFCCPRATKGRACSRLNIALDYRRWPLILCSVKVAVCDFIAVSFRLEIGEFDDLAPLLGLVGDELAEFGR